MFFNGFEPLKEALEGEDVDAVRKATEELTAVSQSFSQKLYEAAAETAGDGSTANTDDGDDVVDAEIIDEGQ